MKLVPATAGNSSTKFVLLTPSLAMRGHDQAPRQHGSGRSCPSRRGP
jgi:hypothetical protein